MAGARKCTRGHTSAHEETHARSMQAYMACQWVCHTSAWVFEEGDHVLQGGSWCLWVCLLLARAHKQSTGATM
eukprot:244467-Pelagomonas_calceolata.AAC.1